MRLAALALVCAATQTSQADGFYYQQSYGVSSVRGEANPMIGESLQLRIAFGWRFGSLQVGPWFSAHLAGERENGYFRNLVGGDPVTGDSDLETMGADLKYNATIRPHLSAYVRGGPRHASGLGALDGYRGWGLGAGTGVALTGRVRALGFVFLPLFFSDRGPKITATVFVDQNVEWYSLRGPSMSSLSTPLVGTSVGFGAGSHF
jgi:hypothetical protein